MLKLWAANFLATFPGLTDETPRSGHNGMDVGPDPLVLDEATEALLWFG